MLSISSKTKKFWIKDEHVFENNILKYRKTITFTSYFDKNVSDYLLTENRGN